MLPKIIDIENIFLKILIFILGPNLGVLTLGRAMSAIPKLEPEFSRGAQYWQAASPLTLLDDN